MRIRIGRTLRLVLALGFLVLMIPFLMFKLESPTDQSISENIQVEEPIVCIRIVSFSRSILIFFIWYLG